MNITLDNSVLSNEWSNTMLLDSGDPTTANVGVYILPMMSWNDIQRRHLLFHITVPLILRYIFSV